jgi:hypothetical protein
MIALKDIFWLIFEKIVWIPIGAVIGVLMGFMLIKICSNICKNCNAELAVALFCWSVLIGLALGIICAILPK